MSSATPLSLPQQQAKQLQIQKEVDTDTQRTRSEIGRKRALAFVESLTDCRCGLTLTLIASCRLCAWRSKKWVRTYRLNTRVLLVDVSQFLRCNSFSRLMLNSCCVCVCVCFSASIKPGKHVYESRGGIWFMSTPHTATEHLKAKVHQMEKQAQQLPALGKATR